MKATISAMTLSLLFLASPLLGASMVEIKSDNTLSRIYSDGKRARMEMDSAGPYTIIDPKSGTAYSVMDADKQVLKMTLTDIDVNADVSGEGYGPDA